jgi:hypothetical protein
MHVSIYIHKQIHPYCSSQCARTRVFGSSTCTHSCALVTLMHACIHTSQYARTLFYKHKNKCTHKYVVYLCAHCHITYIHTYLLQLTVRENLMFSAQLRLPESVSYDEKARRVENVSQIHIHIHTHIDTHMMCVSERRLVVWKM